MNRLIYHAFEQSSPSYRGFQHHKCGIFAGLIPADLVRQFGGRSIEHIRTRVGRPQANGSVERLNQIIQDEFYAAAFQKKLYRLIEEIQEAPQRFHAEYNASRTNEGRYCQGRASLQTVIDGLELYRKHVFENEMEEPEAA